MFTIRSPLAVWTSATILTAAAIVARPAAADPVAIELADISARVIERPLVTAFSAAADGVAPAQPGPERAAKTTAVDLVIDNDNYVGDFGFNDSDGNGVQALYANRFTPDAFPLLLDEVRILFGCPAIFGNNCEGLLFDVVIIEDPDADDSPQTGAQTVAVAQGIVAANDGVTFSTVTFDPPVRLDGPGDVYVGFIPRWIDSGTARWFPAAFDDTSPTRRRSWALRWDEDPADPPVFPADFAGTISTFGVTGSFKIRAFGYLPDGACIPDANTLCLGDGNRFEVRVSYDSALGGGISGDGQATSLASLGVGEGGVFWFFDPKNPELLVKVLDACSQPEPRFWVFFAATTNLGFTLTVNDTLAGVERIYLNPDLQQADAVTDTSAFATCDAE